MSLYNSRFDRQPARIAGLTLGWFVAVVAATAVVVTLIVGIWAGGWFFTDANTTRQAHNAQNNFGAQEGYITEVTNDIGVIDGIIASYPSDGAQRADDLARLRGYGNKACQAASLLTGSVSYPLSMHQWIARNCSAGALSPSSPIRQGRGT